MDYYSQQRRLSWWFYSKKKRRREVGSNCSPRARIGHIHDTHIRARGGVAPKVSQVEPHKVMIINKSLAAQAQPLSQILFIISILIVLLSRTSQQLSFKQEPQSEETLKFEFAARRNNTTEFNLNAYRYEIDPTKPIRAREATQDETETRLLELQNKLLELKRKLELELELSSSNNNNAITRQVTLGSACLSAKDCNKSIAGAHCKLENFTCACLPHHVEYNSTSCLAPSLLGQECLIDAQCKQKVPNSACKGGFCACLEHFVSFRKDKCLPGSQVDDYCLTNGQCQLADRHSYCKWKIANIYGSCKCHQNYMTITSSSGSRKCAPRLGDTCVEDEECLLATRNSVCRKELESDKQSFNWRSSNIDSRRCFCAKNFKESSNRMECVANSRPESVQGTDLILRENGTNFGSVEEQKFAFNLLEKGQLAEYHKFMDSNLSARRNSFASGPIMGELGGWIKKAEAELNKTTSGPVAPAREFKPSSLGKSCSSREDCQLRDPHSDCIAGFCECIKPSSKCRASTTGCHKDTFQCRSGQCISWYFVCDKFKNCDDGSDELDCKPGSCPPEAFQCGGDGACLARARVCDGAADCADGSDERLCNAKIIKTGPKVNGNQSTACHPKAFTCDNGQCLPAFVLCNAIEECADGSDEKRSVCLGEWAGPVAGPGSGPSQQLSTLRPGDSVVVKTNRDVINSLLKQVRSGQLSRAPEGRGMLRARRTRHAKLEPQFEASTCPADAFKCRYGGCRSSAILCSGVDGCGDNSDENRCQVCRCEA